MVINNNELIIKSIILIFELFLYYGQYLKTSYLALSQQQANSMKYIFNFISEQDFIELDKDETKFYQLFKLKRFLSYVIILIFSELQQAINYIEQLPFIIQKMHFTECTPSVNFHLEDQKSNCCKHSELSSQEAIPFQLSDTNNKNVGLPETGVKVSQLNIDKEQILQTTPSVLHINSQDFFEEFSSKFMVKFQQSQNIGMKKALNFQRQQIDNEQVQEITIQNSIEDFKDVRLSFPTDKQKQKENYFGISINNQKGLKSQIISFKKKGCFGKQKFKQHYARQVTPFELNSVIGKNKQDAPQLPQIYQPKSCRNISGNLYFISKATPKDSQLAKKALQKHCVQGLFKKREKSSNFPGFFEKVKYKKKEEKKGSKETITSKKDNIFVKLPNLR